MTAADEKLKGSLVDKLDNVIRILSDKSLDADQAFEKLGNHFRRERIQDELDYELLCEFAPLSDAVAAELTSV